MRSRISAVCGLLMFLSSASALSAQQIRGRVVDEQSRQGLVDVSVLLIGADSSVQQRVATDKSGFFLLKGLSAATFDIVIERLGYARERRTVTFEGADLTLPAFVLRSEAIPLAPVEAKAASNRRTDENVGFKRSHHVLAGERMLLLEQQGVRFLSAIRDLAAGVQVRETYPRGVYTLCIESSRRMASFNMRADVCDWVTIVLDGIEIEDPVKLLRGLSLHEVESLEFLPPAEAGQRYGMKASSTGALLIWSRGRGPHRGSARDRKQ
jgi:hypothetical protein